MRVNVWAVALSLLACSRRESPSPSAVASASSAPLAPASAFLVPATPAGEAPPSLTALGVCNKLRAAGEATACIPDDAGLAATFRSPKTVGSINVARSREHYDRILNRMTFDGLQLATSDEKLVVVFWKSTGSEADDSLIRTVVTTL